jgi:ribosomal protein S18 acetylase RimI-like enzyme
MERGHVPEEGTHQSCAVKIDRDDWLSEVLYYDVFRVSPGSSEDWRCTVRPADLELIVSHQQRLGRSFYYAKVPTGRVDVVHALSSVGFAVVDVSVTFARTPAVRCGSTLNETVIVDDIVPTQYEAVLDIASSSFTYSRFHLDPQIPREAANAVKRAWIANYINGKRGERLMVALRDEEPVGFLAVLASTLDGQPCRVIDLIAVDSDQQGRGVGRALVSYFVQRYVGECPLLRVGTQIANVGSMRLYESAGFQMDETAYVMHAHTENGRVMR